MRFKDGDMFQFDPMALKDTKGLGNFLYRQVQPAFKELTTEKEALEDNWGGSEKFTRASSSYRITLTPCPLNPSRIQRSE